MERFYYYRDCDGSPIVTVCVIKDDNFIGRGVAICSSNDHIVKKRGRDIAYGREVKALMNQESSLEIKRDEVLDIVEESMGYTFFTEKSYYGTGMTEFEKILFKETN